MMNANKDSDPREVLRREGPALESLTRLLMEAGDEWLDGAVDVKALAGDVIHAMSGSYPRADGLDALEAVEAGLRSKAAKRKRIAALALLVLSDPWFREKGELAESALAVPISKKMAELAVIVEPEAFRADGERREELARLCLSLLGLRPKGESAEAAADRLAAVDSVERARLIDLSRKAQERARELREAMARAEAEEAASKMSRE